MLWSKPEYRISSPAGLPPDAVRTFSQREDVKQALPHLSHGRKIHLTTTGIQARDGEMHEYFVLRQGKRRFIFDEHENPTQLSGISELQRKNRLSMTLVVPQQQMWESGFLPQDQQNMRVFESQRDGRRFFRTIEKMGYFAMRGDTHDPKSLENNTDFVQPIPAVVVKDRENNIVFTVRGANNANHDYRLSGMITAPFTMGHSQPSDFGHWRRFLRYGLKLAMYREAAEETALKKGQETFHVFPSPNGHDYTVTLKGILRLRHHYRIKPLGIVYSEERPVDKVHAGVIFVATPRGKAAELTLNGSSKEIHHIVSMSSQQYEEAIAGQEFTPASWNKPIMQEGLVPHLSRRTFSKE